MALKLTLDLEPEYGNLYGLWVLSVTEDGKELDCDLAVERFLSVKLKHRLVHWNEKWEQNYRPGDGLCRRFDVISWLREGEALASAIERSLNDVRIGGVAFSRATVNRKFYNYADYAVSPGLEHYLRSLGLETSYCRVKVVDHPVVEHGLSYLRDGNSSAEELVFYRRLVLRALSYEITEQLQTVYRGAERDGVTMGVQRIKERFVILCFSAQAYSYICEDLHDIWGDLLRVVYLDLTNPDSCRAELCKLKKDASEAPSYHLFAPRLTAYGELNHALRFLRSDGIELASIFSFVASNEGLREILWSGAGNLTLYTASIDFERTIGFLLPGISDSV
ncbi:MAG TPA: hypothetical protein H9867_00530 [Candidatus Corynebacterium gallistercoris]|uniref:Phosphoribosyltransferase domain-containing protein n=1 Tax=Candidatus Corynebacterium gallistercoris TaxID=2838530 RepID=A0A9D1UQ79_9CORY|nr:hypothetical protein [Candidatus Corynebacterium gallistercoris]